jgi:hypothetical protein
MRRQRGAPTSRWLGLAVLGSTIAVLLPYVPSPWRGPAPWQETPQALWWPVHLALVLLGSNGLDDFLDMPLRRRAATAWALALCLLVAPLGYMLGAVDSVFHVEAAVLLALATVFTAWRRLGILGFKTVLAAVSLVWLATATLHEQARAVRAPTPVPTLASLQRPALPAGPLAETTTPLLPQRARLAFRLRPAMGSSEPLPLPHPPKAWTEIDGLPGHFQAVPDQRAAVTLRSEGAEWSDWWVDLPHGAGALVLAESFAPGWRATVNGNPAPVYCADGNERAVLLVAGTHIVRFAYQPLALQLGGQLALGGAVLTLAWVLLALLRRWASSRRNVVRERRRSRARRPPTAARPAIAANEPAGERL